MTDKLDRVAAAGVAVAALILFLGCAYGESRVQCAESPGKGPMALPPTGGAAGLRAIMASSQLRSCTGPRRNQSR